jgi:hypothetical protein
MSEETKAPKTAPKKPEAPEQPPLKCRVGFGAKTNVPGVDGGAVGFMNGLYYPDRGLAEVEHSAGKTICHPAQCLITILKNQE